MSFQAKTDYYRNGLGSGASNLVLTASDENKSAQTAQAKNSKGDIVAEEVFGETMAPNCSYVLSGDCQLTAVTIGNEITSAVDNKYFAITGITIDTAAGSPPTIQVKGEQVPHLTAHNDCYYEIPYTTIEMCHHAQDLFDCYTLTGNVDSYVTNASYSIDTTLTKATKNGETVAWDVSDGKITATLTIQACGSGAPQIDPKTGWKITSPLSKSDGDASYPTYTCTLTQNLTHKV